MGLIDIGGRMPDGVKVHSFYVEEEDFLCASGAALQLTGSKSNLLGKLCLTNKALIMLPYEGLWLKLGEFFISQLQSAILGEYSDMATWMERLGLVNLKGNFDTLKKVLIWPLELIEQKASVQKHNFLFLHSGASLVISIAGKNYDFQMATRGHEPSGFGSAQDFCERINELLLYE